MVYWYLKKPAVYDTVQTSGLEEHVITMVYLVPTQPGSVDINNRKPDHDTNHRAIGAIPTTRLPPPPECHLPSLRRAKWSRVGVEIARVISTQARYGPVIPHLAVLHYATPTETTPLLWWTMRKRRTVKIEQESSIRRSQNLGKNVPTTTLLSF
eukprot:jgi/Psemu1/5991/gm1.5991_g